MRQQLKKKKKINRLFRGKMRHELLDEITIPKQNSL